MSTRPSEAISLSGPPRNVTGLFLFDTPKSVVVPISINVAGQSTVYRAVMRPAGRGTSEIRLRLPEDTPPGVYTGESTIDGKPRRVTAEVESVMRLRVQPKQVGVTTAPTSTVEFAVTVMNDGNVAFDIPKADTFDLDDAVGQERALGKALRAQLPKGERGIDRFFDELRDSHGGEARVTVRSGAGRLEPDDARELKCLLEVPSTAKEGRSYMGQWSLGNTALIIVADIKTLVRPTTKVAVKVATKVTSKVATKASAQRTVKTSARPANRRTKR